MSRTAAICASLGQSFGAQAITPDVYLCSKRQRVGDGRYLVRIPAEDVDALARLPGRVSLADS